MSAHPAPVGRRYVLAEFDTSAKLLTATRTVREAGWTDLDTYSPYPLHGGEEALGLKRSKVPLIALIGGLSGVTLGYGMQWWTNAVDWPINVGNRLPHAAPSFIPITFELGVLLAALSIFFGLMALSRLPQPYHPAFELEAFRSASTHAFWLSVAVDADADRQAKLTEQLTALGATQVAPVTEEVSL